MLTYTQVLNRNFYTVKDNWNLMTFYPSNSKTMADDNCFKLDSDQTLTR